MRGGEEIKMTSRAGGTGTWQLKKVKKTGNVKNHKGEKRESAVEAI